MFWRTQNLLRVMVVSVGLALTTGLAVARPQQALLLQNYQIGTNSFVSGPDGALYLILNNELYRNMSDEGDSWARLGNGVRRVAVDPQNANVLYGIDTQNHVIKSLDAGQKWLTLSTGIPNARPLCVFVNPANPQEVFVGTEVGLFKTTDGGFSWRASSLPGSVSQVLVNQQTPSVLYALSGGTIFVSSDAGGAWRRSSAGLPVELVRGAGRTALKVPVKISLLIHVNWQSPFLLAVTETKGVFRSGDEGMSWKSASVGLDVASPFTSAFVGSKHVIATSQDALYSSSDGTNWKKLPIKSERNIPRSFRGVIGHPKRDGLFVDFRFSQDGGDTTRIAYRGSDGVLIGLNYGVVPHSEVDGVWTGMMSGRPAIFAVTADLGEADQVQKYHRPTFISVSTDGGYSWELIGDAPCGEQGVARAGNGMEMWVYGRCIQRTEDGGLVWTILPGVDFRSGNSWITKIEPDPKDKNILYYCAGVNERHLYRYQYDSTTRQGQSVELKVLAPDVIVAEDDNRKLFTGSGQLSTDGGWTWSDKSTALANVVDYARGGYVRPFRLVSFRGGEIRAVVARTDRMTGNGVVRIVRSQDLGNTWQEVASLPNHALIEYGIQYVAEDRFMVFVNPNDSSNLFVATVAYTKGRYAYESSATKVLESKDGGETWRDIYSRDVTKAPYQNPEVESVRGVSQIPMAQGRALLVGGTHGLWKSEDEGKTWARLGGVK